MPESMRVVVCQELGPPDALVVEEREMPVPGKGQIRVAVRAAGVNYVDGLIAAGRYQLRVEPPFVPGSELAGEVDAVGEGVDTINIGDRVFVSLGTGAFAERIVTRATTAVKLPPTLDFPRAASFHQSYCTAWFALVRRTVVRGGETVLVTGAGGGVGLAAIDVARSLGARVIAVASTEQKRALATAVGAEHAIDPTDDVKTRARELTDGQGVDVVYDVVGGDTAEAALRALRFDGRFCVIGFTGGIPRVPLNLVLLNNRTVVGVEWGGWAMRNPQGNAELVHEVLQQIEAGALHPVAPEERPLDKAGTAIRDLLERRAAGKIVLIP
jgi:NADPH2:quinone reductase